MPGDLSHQSSHGQLIAGETVLATNRSGCITGPSAAPRPIGTPRAPRSHRCLAMLIDCQQALAEITASPALCLTVRRDPGWVGQHDRLNDREHPR